MNSARAKFCGGSGSGSGSGSGGKVWKRLGLRSSSENYYHSDLP
jgi:hypothetical protein